MSSLEFVCNNKRISGANRFSFKKSMDYLCHQFAVEFLGENTNELPISNDCLNTIFLDGKKISTGYFEVRNPFIQNGKKLIWSGRSKGNDLVDCSQPISTELNNVNFKYFTEKVLSPFGLSLIDLVNDPYKFKKVAPYIGETPYQFIERYARKLGVILLVDSSGNIIATKSNKDKAKNIITENDILFAKGIKDSSKKFSDISVYSQIDGISGNKIKYTAKDTLVPRYRPKELISETMVDSEGAKSRAQKQINFNRARSERIIITLSGYFAPDGKPWDINTSAYLKSDFLGYNQSMEIAEVEFVQVPNARHSILTLQPGGFDD